MPNTQAIDKTIVARARLRNRFAVWFLLLANHNCRAKVSPIKIVPRKARSYGVIWKVYALKRFITSILVPNH